MHKYITVIDVETTGRTPGIHEIIQLSAMVVDTTDWQRVSSFTSLVRAYRIDVIDPEALRVNQISMDDIKRAPTSESVRGAFLDWWVDLGISDKINPCGWNYKFDEEFLKLFFGRVEYENLFYYKAVDVFPVAWVAQHAGILDKSIDLSLANASDTLDITHKPHDAYGDVYATWKVLEILCGKL